MIIYEKFVNLNLDKTHKKIIIAINPGAHWLLGVVEPASATIKIYDSLADDNQHTDKIIKKLQCFMKLRMFIPFKLIKMPCNQQSDGHNCGVFSKSIYLNSIK